MHKPSEQINLLILDDHDMFREGLVRTLEREPDMKVVAQCATSREGLALLNRGITMVLLDVDLGNERALGFVEQARAMGYEGPILVVTAGVGGHEAVRLLQAGITGILHKRHSGRILCDSIRKVLAGEPCLETKYLSSLLKTVDRSRTTASPRLTDRDRALLRYLLEGLTNREIAANLDISEGAVKASFRLLFEKVKVRSRTQLVKVALEHYQNEL